uniref:Uncharacterized protein n=1 Tax=Candidatus Methanophaga sp. ANME-1 ERB7 TaxID=2759913 RepID=A0A7G9Z547_9EURY|nr:hypothetical protein BNGNOALE_00007 [Methanosarcinales archaeon ANME-1 ERB7]
MFSIDSDEKLVCTNKFGEVVKTPEGQTHCDFTKPITPPPDSERYGTVEFSCELRISSSFTAECAENAEASENPGVEMRSFFEEEIKEKAEISSEYEREFNSRLP